MDELKSSIEFYLRKAEELRRMADKEVIPAVRDQHLRIASMYQALADHTSSRPTIRTATAKSDTAAPPRIAIPKGLLRSA
jgi:hypothetical protein